jgi:hypothetical protein
MDDRSLETPRSWRDFGQCEIVYCTILPAIQVPPLFRQTLPLALKRDYAEAEQLSDYPNRAAGALVQEICATTSYIVCIVLRMRSTLVKRCPLHLHHLFIIITSRMV